ncbi:MAG: hypothetical protein ACK52P_11220, partial [Alphaproteobacteria bacterium]
LHARGAARYLSGLRADRVQMESSERVKMLEKHSSGAGCVNPCERNMLQKTRTRWAKHDQQQ